MGQGLRSRRHKGPLPTAEERRMPALPRTSREALPRTSREVRLASLPDGLPRPEHFEVVETPLPVPEERQVLVRTRFFHVFAALRTLIGGSVKGAPFPPLLPGDTLFGAAIGGVVSAPADRGVRPGA